MNIRKIKRIVRGISAVDGAGVHLKRIISHQDVRDFDPFLMLDSFDSKNPEDYLKGFPMHPHRGIETVTYLVKGEIDHKDSLGNQGVIRDGESQWMSAGSGILHEEMPQIANHMLGFQLWINLPKRDKMSHPTYGDIKQDMIPVVEDPAATIRILAGEYQGVQALQPEHVDAQIFDVTLHAKQYLEFPIREADTVFLFTLQGECICEGQTISEKTAVLFREGDTIAIQAKEEVRFIIFAGRPLSEPIAWGGPIVMNTQEELSLAFEELREGTFIKEDAVK